MAGTVTGVVNTRTVTGIVYAGAVAGTVTGAVAGGRHLVTEQPASGPLDAVNRASHDLLNAPALIRHSPEGAPSSAIVKIGPGVLVLAAGAVPQQGCRCCR